MLGKKIIRSYSEGVVFVILILFLSVDLSAQEIIKDSLVNERIQSIQRMLKKSRTNTNRWWYGWLAGYAALTVGQSAEYFLSNDKSTRQDMVLGASTSLLGFADLLIEPLNLGRKVDILNSISESTPEDRLRKLKKSEDIFKEVAVREKQGKSLQNHLLCGAVNLTSGLITWLGFKRSVWAGVGNFALNTVVTEVQIWTQPSQTMKDYQTYCKTYKTVISSTRQEPRVKCYLSAFPNRIAFKVMF